MFLVANNGFHGVIVVSLTCTGIFSWHLFPPFIASLFISKTSFLKSVKAELQVSVNLKG